MSPDEAMACGFMKTRIRRALAACIAVAGLVVVSTSWEAWLIAWQIRQMPEVASYDLDYYEGAYSVRIRLEKGGSLVVGSLNYDAFIFGGDEFAVQKIDDWNLVASPCLREEGEVWTPQPGISLGVPARSRGVLPGAPYDRLSDLIARYSDVKDEVMTWPTHPSPSTVIRFRSPGLYSRYWRTKELAIRQGFSCDLPEGEVDPASDVPEPERILPRLGLGERLHPRHRC